MYTLINQPFASMLQKFTFALLIAFTTLFRANAQTGTSEQAIPLSKLTVSQPAEGEYKASFMPYNPRLREPRPIIPTTLSNNVDASSVQTGHTIYVSVLRYKGKVIDICPVSKGRLGSWDFNQIYHEFTKDAVSTEDALDLVSNHQWTIEGNRISRDLFYEIGVNHKGEQLPKYLTRTTEAIKLQ